MRSRDTSFLFCAAILLTTIGGVLARILDENGGAFAYSLDDPYIHLSLAEHLARGHYGINDGEYASPSSSILWPVLLAPFAAASWGQYVPFVANVVFAVGTLRVVAVFVDEELEDRVDGAARFGILAAAQVVFALATNEVGLVFTGLEHGAHVLSVAAVARGLFVWRRTGRIPPSLALGLVVGPLLRYEGLAISGAGLGILFLGGRRRAACAMGALVVAAVAGFSLFLTGLGLPWLPASVVAKSVDEGALGWSVLQRLQSLASKRSAHFLTLGAIAQLLRAYRERDDRPWFPLLLASPVAAHLLFGRYGSSYRYEMYALAWVLLTTFPILVGVRGLVGRRAIAAVLVLVAMIAVEVRPVRRMARRIAEIPRASEDVHDQHFLMAELVRRFAAPVAVNDLGVVSYFGGVHVLDLWGLASIDALRHRLARDDARWMGESARTHGVRMALVYDHWFADFPDEWSEAGTLRLGRRQYVLGGDEVTVFALEPEARTRITELLRELRIEHPDAVVVFDDAGPVPADAP